MVYPCLSMPLIGLQPSFPVPSFPVLFSYGGVFSNGESPAVTLALRMGAAPTNTCACQVSGLEGAHRICEYLRTTKNGAVHMDLAKFVAIEIWKIMATYFHIWKHKVSNMTRYGAENIKVKTHK